MLEFYPQMEKFSGLLGEKTEGGITIICIRGDVRLWKNFSVQGVYLDIMAKGYAATSSPHHLPLLFSAIGDGPKRPLESIFWLTQ